MKTEMRIERELKTRVKHEYLFCFCFLLLFQKQNATSKVYPLMHSGHIC